MRKNLTLFTILLIWSVSGFSQVTPRTIGDTIGFWTTIDFETPEPYITITPLPGNTWQTGHPQKSFFNQAFTIPNAIVTDTVGFYPSNNLSAFDLLITVENTNYNYPMDLFIDFRHKIDSDTLQDGGFISVSWDNGATWNNILDDTLSGWWIVSPYRPEGFPYGNTNLYNKTDTLCNGEHGFSGRSNGWIHSCVAWYDLPMSGTDFWPPDTMLLRFSFISDNIQNNREGWMIDHIRIFSLDLGSGIGETSSSVKASVNPNPVRKNSVVVMNRIYSRVNYTLCDLTGKIILTGRCENCNKFNLQNNGLKPGLYFLKITTENGRSATLKTFFDNP